jgi:hypothetical protein
MSELNLGIDAGGLRRSLDGRAVSASTPLRGPVRVTWLGGTYEWSFEETNPRYSGPFCSSASPREALP